MPQRYRIHTTARASRDIIAICAYIEQESPQNAAAVAQRLLDAIDSLYLLPRRHRIHQHRTVPAKTVHAMPVPPFIVYYRVREPEHTVEILTVRHGRQRQPRRF